MANVLAATTASTAIAAWVDFKNRLEMEVTGLDSALKSEQRREVVAAMSAAAAARSQLLLILADSESGRAAEAGTQTSGSGPSPREALGETMRRLHAEHAATLEARGAGQGQGAPQQRRASPGTVRALAQQRRSFPPAAAGLHPRPAVQWVPASPPQN
jgi:hypothetical protein